MSPSLTKFTFYEYKNTNYSEDVTALTILVKVEVKTVPSSRRTANSLF